MKYQDELPTKCEVCNKPLGATFVDGATQFGGMWAIMGECCHATFGMGLGTDKGQKYDAKTGVKLEG